MNQKGTCLILFFLSALPVLGRAYIRQDPEILQGLTLRNIGPANMSGRFVDIAVVENDPYIFYAASATGGVYKTMNNGVTWKAVFERETTHSVGDIAVHQVDPDIVWVGTGERANRQSSSWGDGVYKSTDGGKTWRNMGLRDSHHIGRILLHPTSTDIVYVAAMGHLWGPNEERGLYKSNDAGENWQKILNINEQTGVSDIALDLDNPDTLYAAAYQRMRKPYGFNGGGPGSGVFKSTDGGNRWKKLTNGLPQGDYGRISIAVYRNNPQIVYISIEQGLRYTASTSYEQRKAGIYRSENKGESWKYMSDWNPRPMYASQILIDPNNDQRIYMENAFSWSDDGGKTFIVPRQSVHSDDRHLWVNPHDSRHLIKASDGALAISYDKGYTWLLVTSLPVSQYYKVSVDMNTPFNIYGGLQDNGSWVGPSATFRSEGILNEDWSRLGGGDGFLNIVDPEEPHQVYVESQYLGLTRVNMQTNEKRYIRPGNTTGWIESRRNWAVWGTGKDFPFLGEEMTPGNWDGPFTISPHDSAVVYAGTNKFWRTNDRGQSWTSLRNLTTGVVRSELTIMGQLPTMTTASLDDGIPFYPTLTAIEESPIKKGLIYAGTDDGNVAISQDGGQSWTQVANRFPNLAGSCWINGIEASHFDANTVYVAINNYRNDDYTNYLYKSIDGGDSWTSIVGDMPTRRVVRTLREDPRNPDVLYTGTEFGLYVTFDTGDHWTELKNNMPTLAINDLLIHPRDNDLVLGTHGRGIWILDNVNALQEITADILNRDAHLFTIEPAEMIRYSKIKAQSGDMVFKGSNPPNGAIIDYYLREEATKESVTLTIQDSSGTELRSLEPSRHKGINRVIWNLRHPNLPAPAHEKPNQFGEYPREPNGPRVLPGVYTVRLRIYDSVYEQPVEVHEDPRINVTTTDRTAWTETLLKIATLYRQTNDWVESIHTIQNRDERKQCDSVRKLVYELRRRILILYSQIDGWTGRLSEDQLVLLSFLEDARNQLSPCLESATRSE